MALARYLPVIPHVLRRSWPELRPNAHTEVFFLYNLLGGISGFSSVVIDRHFLAASLTSNTRLVSRSRSCHFHVPLQLFVRACLGIASPPDLTRD